MTERITCPHPACGAFAGHARNCPLMTDAERREQFDRYAKHFERRIEILSSVIKRQRELTTNWHGRCEILRRENNALRRKLFNRSRPQEVATDDN